LRFKLSLLLLFSLSFFASCQKKPTPPPSRQVDYLPLNRGNWWEYVCYDSVGQESLFIRQEIGDSITLFGYKGFSYESDFLTYDFIHVKGDTVILAFASDYNQRRTLFINRAGVEADWELYSVVFQYEVRAHQEEGLFEAELRNGEKFSDCIKVSTEAHFLGGGSEDLGVYFFAPDVGIVKLIPRSFLKEAQRPFELHRYDLK
jgi:hypothetical protein